MRPKVSVVVPTYNRRDDLKECLESLVRQDYSGYEVVVIDDGSIDGTDGMVKRFIKGKPLQLKYFKQENKGYASARNLGIKKADGEIIAFTDSDCIADSKWLTSLISKFTIDNIGAVRGHIIAYHPKTLVEKFSADHINLNPDNIFGLPTAVTANVAYHKRVLEEVGLFNESLSFKIAMLNCYVGGEDADLAWRVKWRGYEILFEPTAKIYHKYRTSILGLFKQYFGYGAGDAQLFKKHREKIGRRYHIINLKAVLKTVSFLVPELPWRILTLYRRKGDKLYYLSEPLLHLVMHLGWRLGRIYGSIKFRVICI